ncbi:PEP-CTERM sorting domain-containing protein [Duganella sp. FT109W]|uniref:PEP-CTERM sorting domain-containing protein n=1 Tax=Duganella margarita TaxID=2692170 RepID=A0ABW9WND4_9BURK|nr:PEP-CTERM sorting domain-containing protein [Duganella margarita]MYN42736.1 PEP-CTERM sorting domain-containing protein [Duganella margarita]
MKIKLFAAAVVVALNASATYAATIYDNPLNPVAGDCSFSTTCAAQFGRTGDYAAQRFSISSSATINSASFSIFDSGRMPTGASWQILAADGAGGLPGTLLASGSSAIAYTATLIGSQFGYGWHKQFINTASVSLASGSYYFAVQAISPFLETYLGQGADNSGAAEYLAGSWRSGYQGIGGVAIGLYDTHVGAVPEPETYGMLLAGLGLMAIVARRRKA